MVIEFENERQLIDGIMKSGVDVFRFAILFLDRFGVVLNKTSQSRVSIAQQKMLLENTRFEEWKNDKAKIYSERDLPEYAVKAYEEGTGHSIRVLIAETEQNLRKPRQKQSSEFAQYRGEYYFTLDGMMAIVYRVTFDGYATEEEYLKWCDTLPIP